MKHLRLLLIPSLLLLLAACVDPPPAQNLPPVAVIVATPPSPVLAGTTVELNARDSHDPDGSIVSYLWSVDGSADRSEVVTEVVFDEPGSYRIILEVTDDRGRTNETETIYEVLPNDEDHHPGPYPTEGVSLHAPEGMVLNLGEELSLLLEANEPWELSSTADWLGFDQESGPAPIEGPGGLEIFHHVTLKIHETLITETDETTATIILTGRESGTSDEAQLTLHLPKFQGPADDPSPLRKAVGRSSSTTIEVTNTGLVAPLAFELSTEEGDWLTFDEPVDMLGAGSTQYLNVYAKCETPGQQTGRISIASNDPQHSAPQNVTITIDCLTPPESDFDIDVRFVDETAFTPEHWKLVHSAGARWLEVITAGEAPVNTAGESHVCGRDYLELQAGAINGIVIFIDVLDLSPPKDSPVPNLSKPDANAMPCLFRDPTMNAWGLPYAAVVTLDKEYLDNARADVHFEDLIIHEIGHALGLGTMWGHAELSPDTCDFEGKPAPIEYLGEKARVQFNALGGVGRPIIDYWGNPGTRCVHWDPGTFGDELMTGYGSDRAPLSEITVGALEDLGYTGYYELADVYELPAPGTVELDSLRPLGFSGDTIR